MTDDNKQEDQPKEFSDAQKAALKEIAAKRTAANNLIEECCQLAEEHKISFHIGAINHFNTYIPAGGGLSEDGEDASSWDGYDGWQQSGC